MTTFPCAMRSSEEPKGEEGGKQNRLTERQAVRRFGNRNPLSRGVDIRCVGRGVFAASVRSLPEDPRRVNHFPMRKGLDNPREGA